ncbi:MAG: porin family protein [Candidatus Dadabacteria bacterium]
MKTRTMLFCAASVLTGFIANAQGSTQIRGGVNFANVSINENGRVDKANQLTSFQVGIIGNLPLGSDAISLQPGLLFTGKGSKVEKGIAGQTGYFKQTFNPMYIEVPLNVVLKTDLGSTTKFFVGAGPYIAAGVAGKVKTEGSHLLTGNYSYDSDIRFSNDDPTTLNQEEGTGLGVVRRFDYGLNGTAGIEGKTTVVGVNYGLGLAKLQSGSNSNTDNNNKNRVISVTLGFKL